MKPAMLSVEEALIRLLVHAQAVSPIETVSTMQARGRVLASALQSGLDVPSADNTQMDGYAVRAADVAPGAKLRVTQRIPAGQVGTPLAAGTVARIFTGAMIPPGADAVIMQEQATQDGDQVAFNVKPEPGEWVRRRGEDIGQGTVILPAGARLSPQACGLAASVGLATVPVVRRVKVACFFTGDELTMPGEPLRPGAIYNSSRFVLTGLLAQIGCEVTDLGIVPDTLEATRRALREAAREADLIMTSGGVSVGEEDHVKPAVAAEGSLDLWQIAMKPGKPLAYGNIRRVTPMAIGGPVGAAVPVAPAQAAAPAAPFSPTAHFIGLPGNPVSSFVTFLIFVRPFILRLQGVDEVAPTALAMRADFDWPKPDRRQEFLRARMNASGGLDVFPNQGSAVLTSTVWGDGLIDNPGSQPIARGDTVRFLPFATLMA